MLDDRLHHLISNRFSDERMNSWLSPKKCAVAIGHGLERRERVALRWPDEGFLLIDALAERWQELVRIEALEAEVKLLKERFATLEQLTPILVPVETFAPEPYEIIKPFQVVVKFYEDQYVASFFDANLSASGGTQEEAVFNLKDMLIEAFDMLNEIEEDKLGPGPRQQKAVLREFLARRENGSNNKRVS